MASHVIVDSNSGKARGVAFIDQNTKKAYEAFGKVVVLCASTIESTRLLFNSATRQHPAGLGNSSGVLGHYLMDHVGGGGPQQAQAWREANANYLTQELSKIPGVIPPYCPPECKHVYFMYNVRFDPAAESGLPSRRRIFPRATRTGNGTGGRRTSWTRR